MALNPPINRALEPLRNYDEHFILRNDNVDFEINIDGRKRLAGKN